MLCDCAKCQGEVTVVVCVYMCAGVYIHVCVVCMCVYTCMCLCVYMCVFILFNSTSVSAHSSFESPGWCFFAGNGGLYESPKQCPSEWGAWGSCLEPCGTDSKRMRARGKRADFIIANPQSVFVDCMLDTESQECKEACRE